MNRSGRRAPSKSKRSQFALGVPWGPPRPRSTAAELPFVFLNVATTADGKIAPANRRFVPFGSRTDQRLLYELRGHADAILAGARTLDLNPVKLGNGGAFRTRERLERGLAEHPLRIIVSGRASISPSAEIFKHHFSPIIVLTSRSAPELKLRKLRQLADEVAVFGDEEIDFAAALRWLRAKWNVRCLLSEGGGEVNGALFQAGLVNEVYLTLCPMILGGASAPTLADGASVEKLAQATKLKLRALRRVGDEFFLVYRVVHPKRGVSAEL